MMQAVYINFKENEETQDFNRCWWVAKRCWSAGGYWTTAHAALSSGEISVFYGGYWI
jgi:hypothetical protein